MEDSGTDSCRHHWVYPEQRPIYPSEPVDLDEEGYRLIRGVCKKCSSEHMKRAGAPAEAYFSDYATIIYKNEHYERGN